MRMFAIAAFVLALTGAAEARECVPDDANNAVLCKQGAAWVREPITSATPAAAEALSDSGKNSTLHPERIRSHVPSPIGYDPYGRPLYAYAGCKPGTILGCSPGPWQSQSPYVFCDPRLPPGVPCSTTSATPSYALTPGYYPYPGYGVGIWLRACFGCSPHWVQRRQGWSGGWHH